MAGPLNGLGGQQVPLATTFQPSKDNEQVKQQQDQKEAARTQALGTAKARESEQDRSDEALEAKLAEALSARNSGSGEVRRGSVVDVTV